MKVPKNAALGKATVTFRLKGYGGLDTDPATYEIEVIPASQVASLKQRFPKVQF